MSDELFRVRATDVKKDLYTGIIECNKRGLMQSAKWLAEFNHGLSTIELNLADIKIDLNDGISKDEIDNYYLAKSYFDCREYDRAGYFTRNCKSSVPKFLHFYSIYMAKEKKRLDNLTENTTLNDNSHIKDLTDLLSLLKTEYNQRKLDGYGLYLYGVVLKKLDLTRMAMSIFVESVHQAPTLWGSWIELASLLADKEKLFSLKLPNHWMKFVFFGLSLIELFLNDEGLKQLEDLQTAGFRKCHFITTQMAIAYHNKRDVDKAIEIFQNLLEVDPYRLDNLDIYSNLLFVKELKTEMAFLAHKAVEINKYRPETCCVIGNYYSIRSDHQKAVIYFQRALKLNPQYLSAWTLMGHEFMEMKNTNAAIQSYRQAVEVNRRDFRAWYGLGQSYEILKMPFYSLYYYKIAQQLRPYDSRMLVALGETYEKLDKNQNSLKCYISACNVGDIEGVAILKLANLYEKLGDIENAIPVYKNFCADDKSVVDKSALCHAYLFLGSYYESIGLYDEASHYVYKCLEHDETKTEAKALLKTIASKRALLPLTVFDCNEVSMDESDMIVENSGIETQMVTETPEPQNEEPDEEETEQENSINTLSSSFFIQ